MMTMVLAFSLVACGGSKTEAPAEETAVEEGTEGTTAETADGKVYKIGIVQLVEHVALDAATEGFMQAVVDALGEDAVEFDLQNGSRMQKM